MNRQDDIIRGAVLVAISTFMIAAMNATGKFLSTGYHPVEMVFYRNILIFAPVCLYFQMAGKWHLVRTQRLKSQLLRGVIGTGGVVLAFWAVSMLPLADAVTLMYAAPLFVAALSYPLLKEKIGKYRTGAIVAGFIGVAIVAAPSGESLPVAGVILALCAALFHGLVQILLRDLGQTERTMTTVFYFMATGIVVTGLCMPFVAGGPPRPADFWLLGLLALTGGLQQVIKTKGYSLAPVAVTSPINYTGLIWAALLGLAVWQDVPGWNVALGAAIIIGANLFIVWRTRQLKKKGA